MVYNLKLIYLISTHATFGGFSQRNWISWYLLTSSVRKLDKLGRYNAENFFFNVVFMNWNPTWNFHNSLFWKSIRFKKLFFRNKPLGLEIQNSEAFLQKEIQKVRNRPVCLQPCCKTTSSTPHILETFNGFPALIVLYLFVYNLLKVSGRYQEECQNKTYVDLSMFQRNLFLCWYLLNCFIGIILNIWWFS